LLRFVGLLQKGLFFARIYNMRRVGGAPTVLTDDMKRSSLKKFQPRLCKWLKALEEDFVTDKATNVRGRRVPKYATAMVAPQITICKAGSQKAVDIAMRSRWPGVPVDVTAPHLKPSLLEHLDVVIVTGVSPLSSVENGRKYLSIESDSLCHQQMITHGGWSLIRRSCLVIRGVHDAQPEIISLYITATSDDRIKSVMCDAEAVYHGMKQYLKPVKFNKQHVFQRNQKRKPDMALRGMKGQIAGRPHYALGNMYVDGVFRFRFASGFGYYSRDTAASADDKYLESQLRLFCGMSHLESQHAPALSQYRNIVSDRVPAHEGTFPGVDKQMCAAGSIGATMGYACDGHNDSSFPGITETIFWSAAKTKAATLLPKGERWTFANAEAGLLFDLQHAALRGGCCLYIPGSVMHNSMPTGCSTHTVHQGTGFVLVNKGAVLGPAAKTWFAGNYKSLRL
jgi:hypothetical protein